jgi:hypothetical protein
MQPFAGQRVEVSGMLMPAPPSAASATGAAGAATATLREFRVVSVRPIGSCPQ